MAESFSNLRDAFDFSLNAADFKERLWKQLKEHMESPAVQPLEDEDLEWINAAGTPYRSPKPDEPTC